MNKWSNSIPWFKSNDYICRCIEESFGPAKSSGNPMLELKWEVVAPEEMEYNGEKFNIAGVSAGLSTYFVTKTVDAEGNVDTEKSSNNEKRLQQLYDDLELGVPSVNVDNPPLKFKGLLAYCLMEDNKTEQRKSPTKEQLSKGQKMGDIMLHPKTKQPMVVHYPKIAQIICRAPELANKPF
jgi:hypothetical protein